MTIRAAGDADLTALERLARLDSRSPERGPLLLALVDGELVAALPLAGGPPLANPYRPTEAVVRLLELRAGQIHRAELVSRSAVTEGLRRPVGRTSGPGGTAARRWSRVPHGSPHNGSAA